MNAVFADTSFYLALFSSDDVHHEKATRLSAEVRQPVVVTEFVLLEVANALCDARSRHVFSQSLPHLKSDPMS
ncbi:MAG: PIN domain-containing protein [Planctomycetes bacterium]|nr:PIN domain-containing protein [Planctomycetota bacterium]